MQTTADISSTLPTLQPQAPAVRLALAPHHADRAVLDGGWWPHSRDPATEVPALVAALTQRYGPIRDVMLNNATWAEHPRRLPADTRVIRMGWFASQDPALAIAITAKGDQLDLLVVPPATSAADAGRAMAAAADPDVFTSAAGILAALSDSVPAGAGPESAGVWDNEGGRAFGGPRVPEASGPPAATIAAVIS
ncbi:DUF5994 family protein [Catellatospora tritici]|uniref:DUF5994 family protein n=1 Tax=Catellatospora tritici TaxID=2851566 RepID=UPI001C2CE489|nr:DUF5994 family protein [Catellatospora tritici]MBV1856353.1 hypothetical protein [Catellatospora tritici]